MAPQYEYYVLDRQLYRVTAIPERGAFAVERYVAQEGYISAGDYTQLNWNGQLINKQQADRFIVDLAVRK
ncbi:MAG: hypothetical protein SFT92_06155 [Rickettsiales bacterium]|nr:hypothetical protein [Rickettsiales bacterium]